MYLLQSRAGMIETRAPTTIPYKYTLYLNLSEADSDGDRQVQAEVRVDPSKPAGRRARIVTSKGHRKVLTEFLEDIENPKVDMTAKSNRFWCRSIHDDEDVDLSIYTVISETDTEAVLKPNPDKLTELLLRSETENLDKSDRRLKKKLLSRIDGQITVSKRNGGTKNFKAGMTRSGTIKVIAKIKAMDINQTCAVAPNGHQYASEIQFSIDGKALGEKFSVSQNIRISDLTPIR